MTCEHDALERSKGWEDIKEFCPVVSATHYVIAARASIGAPDKEDFPWPELEMLRRENGLLGSW